MKKTLLALLVASSSFVAPAVLADPSGTYAVRGVNPDGTSYEASVLVSKVGDTFAITYTLEDDTKLSGTAIGDDELLSIGYAGQGDIGVALMYRRDKIWEGVWTYLGAEKMGTEEWRRR
jgi:hypothetical protein